MGMTRREKKYVGFVLYHFSSDYDVEDISALGSGDPNLAYSVTQPNKRNNLPSGANVSTKHHSGIIPRETFD